MKRLLYILMFLPFIALGQTTTENYVKTIVYKDETGNINAANINVTYLDGLGRPIQQIAGKQAGNGNDIITHIEYDAYSRQVREYLPYAAETSNLAFIDPVTAQANTVEFYNNSVFENTSNPWSEQFIEASPLNRVRKVSAPGTAWLGNTADDNDRTVKTAYLTNEENEVLKFSAVASWGNATNDLIYNTTFVNSGQYYAANELYKTITQDENKKAAIYTGTTDLASKLNTVEEFKNKEGQLILKRTYNQEPGQSPVPLDTYYVYDQYGNLTYVLPPKRTTSGVIDLGKYCYQYKYDSRNRLIEKKLPGKTWEFLVYDKLDRVVATGPAINPWGGLDTDTGWLVTQYDAFGRVAYTGWVAATGFGTTLRRDMQLLTWNITAKTTSPVTINSISVYYTNTLPSSLQSGFKLLTVNYYDNYVYPNATAPTSSTQVEGVNVQVDCKGLPTGTWVRALQTATAGELSYTFYDKKGRPLRTRTTNYLGGYTQLDSKLGFDGRVLYTVTRHKRLTGNTELKTTETFDYTAQDRLLSQTHQIGSQAAQLMAFNTYNAIGQLTSKKVGNTSSSPLQQIDYKYNIRGWLTDINNILELNNGIPANLPSGQPQDLFAYKINYTAIAQQSIGGAVVPQYNGNIAEVSWRTATDNIQRRYGFTYDKLNRLTDAWYQIPQASVPVRNSYDEHVQYDDNGNIRNLQRNGGQDTLPPATEIDELTYFYDGNQLTKVTDTGNVDVGFKDVEVSGVADYTYDAFGNLKTDKNKYITAITYNHLNLPTLITISGNPEATNNGTISYLYNAAGVKLKKTVTPSGGTAVVTDYLGGYQYVGTVLEFFPTSEGYVKHTLVGSVSNYNYVFQYKDHLGNNRVSYTVDSDNVLKILEEDHYYPFGLKHEGYSATQSMLKGSSGTGVHIVPVLSPDDVTYKYMYNGKELQDELGLAMYDFGARNYDPAIGRWMNIDPLAEIYRCWTPYHYAANNPVVFVDPDGMGYDVFGNQDPNGGQAGLDTAYAETKGLGDGGGGGDGDKKENKEKRSWVGRQLDSFTGWVGRLFGGKKEPTMTVSIDEENVSWSFLSSPGYLEFLDFFTGGDVSRQKAALEIYRKEGINSYLNQSISDAHRIELYNMMGGAYGIGSSAPVAKGVTQYSDELLEAAQKMYPKKAGRIEQHHPFPQYMGGPKKQTLVPLDASYHQQITNEFYKYWARKLPGAAKTYPTLQQASEIMEKVYSKYPLPKS